MTVWRMSGPSIVWLRDDLRLADNPALVAAVERGEPLIVLYLFDEVSPGIRPLGGASRWWLQHSLSALEASIADLGGRLLLLRGAAATVLPRLVAGSGARAVFWNRRYGASRKIDTVLKSELRWQGVEATSFQANLLFEPWTVVTGGGTPYRVFTPFWKACLDLDVRDPLPVPMPVSYGLDWAKTTGDTLGDWDLLPTRPDWAGGLRESWHPGEAGGHERLDHFVTEVLDTYHRRYEPAQEVTSQLSPHLRFGEISPFQVWQRLHGPLPLAGAKNAAKFLSELGWREFNWNILYHFPKLATQNFRSEFDAFPWEQGRRDELEAWHRGHTGIPLVDAGMRELWRTGYMQNRVRMVAASFLVKNLLVDWRIGEQWFWDTLVDADEANNPGNWQWVAGSGADAAPYFRVFNPVLQESKFDQQRNYIRRWLPEVDTAEYPAPIIDLAQSRRDALAAYEVVKRAGGRQ